MVAQIHLGRSGLGVGVESDRTQHAAALCVEHLGCLCRCETLVHPALIDCRPRAPSRASRRRHATAPVPTSQPRVCAARHASRQMASCAVTTRTRTSRALRFEHPPQLRNHARARSSVGCCRRHAARLREAWPSRTLQPGQHIFILVFAISRGRLGKTTMTPLHCLLHGLRCVLRNLCGCTALHER